ncbi:MAG: metallophosphoesterase [Desulfobulbus sp.]|nr:metallophosphoesterase [Desulfobulbus sp.]
MAISILHISDLHRDPTQGIGNGPLVRSLLNDRDRYIVGTPAIASPSLIVVSGDIVYGVPAAHPTPNDTLATQYQEAEAFLIELANSFLNGDRQRLILVPGNHDVSFPATLAALTPLSSPSTHSLNEALADLFSPHSTHRWSWKDLQLFKLSDNDGYNRRIELFAEFYFRFYGGKRNYSFSPDKQYDIFSYPSQEIVIVAFNSCYNNDPLHKAGCIHPDAIAASAREIESLRYQGYIPIAVWHHNTAGGPHSDDYMDADTLQVLIDCGFSIGLHGHQHKSTFIDERFRFGTGRKITVISAGTLCGGLHSLPHGHSRSYNVIEIDTSFFSATVHQRQMVNETLSSPVWSSGWYAESCTSMLTFEVQKPLIPQASLNSKLSQAESLIAQNDYDGARGILLALAPTDGVARRMLAECYTVVPYDTDLIISLFPPQSVSEAVLLADALWEMGDKQRLGELLRLDVVAGNSDPTASELRYRYQARVK